MAAVIPDDGSTPAHAPVGDSPDYPLISQSVAMLFGVFGIVALVGLGWTMARSTAGLNPFQFPRPGSISVPAPAAQQAQVLNIVATDLKFSTNELRIAAPGAYTVHLENKGAIAHDFTIDNPRFKVLAQPGKSSEGKLKIEKPGTYTFYCAFEGHQAAGMVGKLIVGDGSPAAVQAVTNTAAATHDMAGVAGMTTSATDATVQHASHATTVSTQKEGNQEMVPEIVDGVKVFHLTARPVQWEVLPGVYQEAWTYNDQLPGPVIRVTEGDRVRVLLTNQLPEETVLHFHGLRIPNGQDGVPDVTQPTIKVGETFTYEFVANPAGTYVYHTHYDSVVQETKGLYGVVIVDPKPGTALAQRDAQYAHDYLQVLSEFSGYFLVNGKSFPATPVLTAHVGEKVRIRLVNLGQSTHPMHLHGFHFKVVGTDGMPVMGEPLVKDTINIAPGERYDLEFVADNPGTWIFHCHILSHVQNQGVEPGGMLTVLKVD